VQGQEEGEGLRSLLKNSKSVGRQRVLEAVEERWVWVGAQGCKPVHGEHLVCAPCRTAMVMSDGACQRQAALLDGAKQLVGDHNARFGIFRCG